MEPFMRARSDEQKAQRLSDIKAAARRQFAEHPYHEITLTTIAEELDWSRANLYKYVGTKEEIFLALDQDECQSYFDSLLAALPEGCGFTSDIVAEVWAGIANAHQDYFRLGEILSGIIEANVGLDRLVAFKRCYLDGAKALGERLISLLGIDATRTYDLIETVYYHGVGLVGTCNRSPLVAAALDELGIEPRSKEFRSSMRDFIAMCLEYLTRGSN